MRVSILGCGWLGLPLAKSLVAQGHTVKGSTTTESKLTIISDAGIEPFLISLSAEEMSGDTKGFLENVDILIVDIPPKLRGNATESFVDKIKILIPYIKQAGITKVLFVSSTSVYADDNSVVTENTTPKPETEGGKQLLESELLLQGNTNFDTTVLRFGGLVGDDRHPVRYLAGRDNLENPDGSVNLIHQKDCIGIIQKIIEKDSWGSTFNAVAPHHPTREEYYTQKAKELELEPPKFNRDVPSVGKTIESNKVITDLEYDFIKSDLL